MIGDRAMNPWSIRGAITEKGSGGGDCFLWKPRTILYSLASLLLLRRVLGQGLLHKWPQTMTSYLENTKGDIGPVMTKDGKDGCLFFRLILSM